MAREVRYFVDDRGNVKAAVFDEGRVVAEAGHRIACLLQTEGRSVRRRAATAGDGVACFDLNVLDLLSSHPDAFRLRCEARLGGRRLRTAWSEPYEPVHYTPAASTSAPADRRVALDGDWLCRAWPFGATERTLLAAKARDPGWATVTVPGAVHLRSAFESPGPHRDETRLTHIDPRDGYILRKAFLVPASFRRKTLRLRVEGLYPGGVIFVNGRKAGEVWTGLNAAEFDVTSLCRPGRENVIAIRLYRKHPFARLDMPRWVMDYCGIHRPIFIQALAPLHLAELRAEATLQGKRGPGLLRGVLRVANDGQQAAHVKVEARLFDGDRPLTRKPAVLFDERLAVGETRARDCRIEVPGIAAWSAEKPKLYRAVFCVQEGRKAVETVERCVGFRRFELKGERPLLNGVPIKIRGINRLEFHPATGLAQDEDWLRREVFMLKRANLNGVRTHLCSSRRFIERCDEDGLYVVQEIPIDWAAEKPDLISEVANLGVMLNRIQRTILRDRDHPSILAWGVGNENLVHDPEKREAFWTHLRLFHHWAKRLDPTRPTMFPPPGPLGTRFRAGLQAEVGDIADIHYTFLPVKEMHKTGKMTVYRDWQESRTLTRKELIARGWSGVWFSSEYFCFGAVPELLEAPYLSFIEEEHPEERFRKSDTWSLFRKRFLREWSYMENDPSSLGGAFFHFKDPAAGQPWKWIAYDEGLPWGIVDPWLVPNPLYWIVRSLFAPVRVAKQVRVKKGQRRLTVAMANRYSFTNLREGACYVQESNSKNYLGMTSDWRAVRLDVPPNAGRNVRIPFSDASWKALDEGRPVIVRFTFEDPQGYLITTADTVVLPQKLTREAKARGGDFVLAAANQD